MLPERDLGRLADILKYATRALSHVNGMTFEQFNESATAIDAVIHCLAVIGEAAGRLSGDARTQFPQFDWSAMTGMRHRLIHDYGHIDYEIMWDVVQEKLPTLRDELTAFLSRIE
jgi:uncharacterized protein with HEPN domain